MSVVAVSVVAVGDVSVAAPGDPPSVTQLDHFRDRTAQNTYGEHALVLTNGNYVIAGDGTVELFDGTSNTLIAQTTRASGPPVEVGDSNFVVPATVEGPGGDGYPATLWVDGELGHEGRATMSTSLVRLDGVPTVPPSQTTKVTVLENGNYVVSIPSWSGGGLDASGAVVWGDGNTGVTGPVDTSNSLYGTTAGDGVGLEVTPLTNGNYVVAHPRWDDGATEDAGAVTWGDGNVGVTGTISPANSLVGSTEGDGSFRIEVTPLSNGNYVVAHQRWDNGAIEDVGAVTWCDGTIGVTGTISPANSLVGSTEGDLLGSGAVTPLSNGSYVVASPEWDFGSIENAGAATFGDGTSGVAGPITSANSLHGGRPNDRVGTVTALTSGNYVVSSVGWDYGGLPSGFGATLDAGAVTWGDGTVGVAGPVSFSNSLYGSRSDDLVGSGAVTALSNGNYVVVSDRWQRDGVGAVGAITWGDGTAGTTGPVGDANSLTGSSAGDL